MNDVQLVPLPNAGKLSVELTRFVTGSTYTIVAIIPENGILAVAHRSSF